MCLCGILVGSYSNLQIVDQVDVRLQIRRYPPRKYYTKTISFNVTLGPSIKVILGNSNFSISIWISTLYLIWQVNHGNSEIEIIVANEALNLIVTQNNAIQYPSSCLDRFRSDENHHQKNRSESPPPNYDEVMLSSTSANNTPPPEFEMC